MSDTTPPSPGRIPTVPIRRSGATVYISRPEINPEVRDFVRRSADELQDEYHRIERRTSEDPGTAGDQGEENWAALLRERLPDNFKIVTKGRILTESGWASRQMDVLVLRPSYPRILIGRKLYLSGGVAAAFECKVTLRSNHVKAAFEKFTELKRRLTLRLGSPYRELNAGVICGLLAHSHCWKGRTARPIENVQRAAEQWDGSLVTQPRESLDFICVADLATWKVQRSHMVPSLPYWSDHFVGIYGAEGVAETAYLCYPEGDGQSYSPIGTLVSGLYADLAWDYPDMRHLEAYFRDVNMRGSGAGSPRKWPLSVVYSDATRKGVQDGRLSQGRMTSGPTRSRTRLALPQLHSQIPELLCARHCPWRCVRRASGLGMARLLRRPS